MAFPTISATTSSGALSGTPQSVPVAAHASGDRLVVIYALDGGTSNYSSNAEGWTLVGTVTESQNAINLLIFEKIATSSGETLTITLAATRAARAIAYTITGSDTATAMEMASANSAGTPSTSPDPPNLTPSWGAADTLWLAALAQDNGTITLSAYPANYSLSQLNNSGGTTSTPSAAVAGRQLNASSENPGAFTISGNEQWTVATLAIKPGASTPTIQPSDIASAEAFGTAVVTFVASVAPSGIASGEAFGTAQFSTGVPQILPNGIASAEVFGTATFTQAGNIRLSIGVQTERGGNYASQSNIKYVVFNATHTDVVASGSSLTTNASGIAVIDVNGSPYAVGDYVPVLLMEYNAATSAPDRVVRSMFGFVQAQAQA